MAEIDQAILCPKCGPPNVTGYITACAYCKDCNKYVPYAPLVYCGPCSMKLECCYKCGERIQDATSYLMDVTKNITEKEKAVQCAKFNIEKMVESQFLDELRDLKQQLPTMTREAFLKALTVDVDGFDKLDK